MSIIRKKRIKKNGRILSENSKISSMSTWTYGHRKQNLNVSKTKPVATRGHSLLLLLFFQNKSCMHNEVGTCTEILPRRVILQGPEFCVLFLHLGLSIHRKPMNI